MRKITRMFTEKTIASRTMCSPSRIRASSAASFARLIFESLAATTVFAQVGCCVFDQRAALRLEGLQDLVVRVTNLAGVALYGQGGAIETETGTSLRLDILNSSSFWATKRATLASLQSYLEAPGIGRRRRRRDKHLRFERMHRPGVVPGRCFDSPLVAFATPIDN